MDWNYIIVNSIKAFITALFWLGSLHLAVFKKFKKTFLIAFIVTTIALVIFGTPEILFKSAVTIFIGMIVSVGIPILFNNDKYKEVKAKYKEEILMHFWFSGLVTGITFIILYVLGWVH